MTSTFRAVIAEQARGGYVVGFRQMTTDELSEGGVLVEVAYSSLNYKDGLAVTGRGKIIRNLPMICGIDLAGTVIESASADFATGDKVIATGHGLGETHWGGYSQVQRLPAELLLPLPSGFSLQQAMAVGTAGFTAMLCVLALEHMGVIPNEHEVIITGASGGVGSIAVALLSRLGYKVAASTGRPDAYQYLRHLGATTVIDRSALAEKGPALASGRWAGGIDVVGGTTLASVLAATVPCGAVAACGLAGGTELPATVLPFILRNVSLLGISASWTPKDQMLRVWKRLARDLSLDALASISRTEALSNIHALAEDILAGRVSGRTVIDVNL